MSLISMTGYGSARAVQDGLELQIEIKTVNSRYLDLSFRMPQLYSNLEQVLSKIVKDKITRGRVDIFVNRKASSEDNFEVRFSEKLYNDFVALFADKFKDLKKEQASLELLKLALSRKEILEITGSNSELSDLESSLVEKTLLDALSQLVKMRTLEGQSLESNIESLFKSLENELGNIKEKSEKFNQQALDKVRAKLDKYKKEISFEPDRVAQELAILFDRTDISEEIARIESHFVQFKNVILKNEGGKKIEFLLQEFGREFNTIGSKSQSSEISQHVIGAKTILEKIREQVANIE